MADEADEFEELPACEPAWMRLDRATAVRKRLLAAGYRPLPVNGKVPPIKGWSDIYATNTIIDRWAIEYADATNTGIITRTAPAVDIDVLDGTVADELQKLAEQMIGAGAVRTGRAPKRALLFRTDASFDKIVTPVFVSPDGRTHKVEILGWGQQIVVHGIHPETHAPYTWRDTEPGPDLKVSALPLLTAEKANAFIAAAAQCMGAHGWTSKKKPNGAGTGTLLDTQKPATERERVYARATLDGCADELGQAPSGERNDTLNKKAFRLGTMVARGWITSAQVFDVLFDAAATCGLNADDGEEATRSTLKSGLDDGMKCPHPDLDDTGGRRDETYTEAGADRMPADLGERDAGDDVGLPPPRGWLLAGTFCRKFFSSLLGHGGVGKTALRYAQYLSLAVGRPLTGEHVFQRCRVLIISLEDSTEELQRRLLAARLHYGISPADVKGWLFYTAPGASAGKLMTLDSSGRTLRGQLAASTEATIIKRNLDFVAIDPFVKSHAIPENENSIIDDVMQVLTDLSDKYDIAIDSPHHISKGAPDPGNATRGRGASSMVDAGRLISTATTMSGEEAEMFGIAETERKQYIRIDSGKVNITKSLGCGEMVPPRRRSPW